MGLQSGFLCLFRRVSASDGLLEGFKCQGLTLNYLWIKHAKNAFLLKVHILIRKHHHASDGQGQEEAVNLTEFRLKCKENLEDVSCKRKGK